MCLWLHHNTLNLDTDEDILPFRQVEAPRRKKGVTGLFFHLHHNMINVRKWRATNGNLDNAHGVGELATWVGSGNQHTGLVVNAEELNEKEQMILTYPGDALEDTLEDKLKKKKQRLQEAKVNFQKSMDQLNDELVFLKTDV